MTIKEIISKAEELNEDSVIYAKREDGKFLSSSEAVLLDLTDEEIEVPTQVIANKYCPGFEYFLEISLVKEIIEDLQDSDEYKPLDKQVERIIHYAEFDA